MPNGDQLVFQVFFGAQLYCYIGFLLISFSALFFYLLCKSVPSSIVYRQFSHLSSTGIFVALSSPVASLCLLSRSSSLLQTQLSEFFLAGMTNNANTILMCPSLFYDNHLARATFTKSWEHRWNTAVSFKCSSVID